MLLEVAIIEWLGGNVFFEEFFVLIWWRGNGEFRGFFLSVLNSEKPVRLSSSRLPERINDYSEIFGLEIPV